MGITKKIKKRANPRSISRHASSEGKIAEAILGFIARIPKTDHRKSKDPERDARSIANSAAAKAALAAGSLALPPGPLGWLTILPELLAVWKIQAQLVVDIAGVYGKKTTLDREQMIYCLFRHTAAQAVRDLVVRVGERYLVRRASVRVIRTVAHKIGIRITQRAVGKALSRWLPLVGAVGVGGYAYLDTASVGKTAIELFQHKIETDVMPNRIEPTVASAAALAIPSPRCGSAAAHAER